VKEPISKRPAFIEPLHDIVVMAGEEVTFMCKATGIVMNQYFVW
jgi:hypothetical protein